MGRVRDALAAGAPVLAEMARALGAAARSWWCPATTTTRCCAAGSSAATRRAARPGIGGRLGIAREPLGALVEAVGAGARPRRLPGGVVRDDVYAIHGHYGDRHNTVPILERLGAGLTVARRRRAPPAAPARAEDYEAALAPMYAWADTVAQSGGLHIGGRRELPGRGDGSSAERRRAARRSVRSRAMALGLAAAVAG